MFVCICKGITCSQIKSAVENGASSFREVRHQLGAATQCGNCAQQTKEIIQQTLNSSAPDKAGAPCFTDAMNPKRSTNQIPAFSTQNQFQQANG